MRIGFIDVDGHNFPNIPLMKLSAWHKKQGDQVEWYAWYKGFIQPYDVVYMSKVFSFTPDYQNPVCANKIVKGGSGYAINLIGGGVEWYCKSEDADLPYEIEHIYPDYELYGITDTAYGFLTRGCPRRCNFCHVKNKEGIVSHKVADLSEFWSGQKKLVLCDPNILACMDWKELLQQIIDSKARTDFNQGLDIRLMTYEKAEMINQIKMSGLHFAWDRYQDKDIVLPKLKAFRQQSKINPHNLVVYVLCNYDTTIEQDLERIYTLRDMGYAPYVMLYDKEHIPRGHELKKLQRWVNNRFVFWKVDRFEDYKRSKR